MTVDLVGKGAMTWGEALNDPELAHYRGGGAYPMSMKGAPQAAEDLRKGIPATARDPAERAEKAAEFRHRQIQMAEGWLRVQMAASKSVLFTDEASAEEWIYKHMLRFYRLKARTDLAAVG